MIKCECGYENEKAMLPMICPQCGNVAMPFVIKEVKKGNAIVKEAVALIKLTD